jgi:hypothetical protein
VGLARAVGVPFGYLFLSTPPDTSLPIPDYRKSAKPPTAELRQLLSDSILKRDWYRDHARSEGAPKATFVGRFTIRDGVATIAADIRNTLGITPQLRRATDSWADYLSVLARRADDRGVLVLRTSVVGNNTKQPVSRNEVQGFALADQWAPLIFVNSADYKAAQIFT